MQTLDPDRLQWEVDVLAAYADCAARHAAMIAAWPSGVAIKSTGPNTLPKEAN